ncbi:MAG: aminotransferase DegT, partial [Clostridiales bacterium]|nr:aminotransferase DegT [Clostridiales bacterium]
MINVTKTYVPDIKKYEAYMMKIFDSAWMTNNGQLVQELEKRLKEYLGVKNVVLVSNGTLALQIAYKALGLSGDVLTTPFSFAATVSSQVWEGLNPVFVDIDEATLNLDWQEIEKHITPKTSGIIPVHVFGNPCNVEEIEKISNKYNLRVIYDGAHAFGVKYMRQSVLNYGDISILSFHATKVFHTIEGGALIVNDDNLYEKIKLMINFGIKGPDIITELGINGKMNEFQAAMGLCVLDDFEKIINKRRMVYDYYRAHIPVELKLQDYNISATRNYGYFPVIFQDEASLIKAKDALAKEQIYTRRYFYPSLDRLPYLKFNQSLPVSNSISQRILCL